MHNQLPPIFHFCISFTDSTFPIRFITIFISPFSIFKLNVQMLLLSQHIYIYDKNFKNPLFLGKFMVTTFEEARKYGVQRNAGISLNIWHKKRAEETSLVLIEIEIYNIFFKYKFIHSIIQEKRYILYIKNLPSL